MPVDEYRSEIERQARKLDAVVQRAREASLQDDLVRQEIASLVAKVEALQRRIDSRKKQTPDSQFDDPLP